MQEQKQIKTNMPLVELFSLLSPLLMQISKKKHEHLKSTDLTQEVYNPIQRHDR